MRIARLCAHSIVVLASGVACSNTSGDAPPAPGTSDAATGGGGPAVSTAGGGPAAGSGGGSTGGGPAASAGGYGAAGNNQGGNQAGPGGRTNSGPLQGTGGIGSSAGGGMSSGGAASGGRSSTGGSGGAAAGGTPGAGGMLNANNGNPTDCGISQPAFCETFEKQSPGGRGGPLDESLWSFSRYSHLYQYFLVRIPASTASLDPTSQKPISVNFPATFCGKSFTGLVPGTDVGICPGLDGAGQMSNQLNEVYDDSGDFAFNDMRIRQPFDFTGRTGTIVFDVDAKINPENLGHGWWVEFWITEDPEPMPYHGAPTVSSYPRSALGLAFQGTNCNKQNWENSLTQVVVTKDHKIFHDQSAADFSASCFKTADAKLNRFKITVSQSQAEVYVSDANSPGNVRKVATVNNLGLPFTRGYVHLQHSQYNSHKDGEATPSQTYRWDNVGFDGPVLKTPRGYDVQEPRKPLGEFAGALVNGWLSPPSVTVEGVDLAGATKASLNFNIMSPVKRTLQYRFNGGAWHSFNLPAGGIPSDDGNWMLRTYSVDAPLSELVAGTNKIDFQVPTAEGMDPAFANIDLTVEVE